MIALLWPVLASFASFLTGSWLVSSRFPVCQGEEMTVEWPMLMLYDEVNQSDFVGAFDERAALEAWPLRTHFSRPLPWFSVGFGWFWVQKRSKTMGKRIETPLLDEEQLQLMFPEDRQVDWDEQGKYVWSALVAYLEPETERNARETSTNSAFRMLF